tara:strand:+ start:136 stop:450 length:315 start_codon:yes stop_codon:yes gene_type:complete
MTEKQLQKKYADLIKGADLANGRKETVSYLHKAEKVRTKIVKKLKKKCPKCNGYGYRRISIDGAKTCLICYGKGFILNVSQTDSNYTIHNSLKDKSTEEVNNKI